VPSESPALALVDRTTDTEGHNKIHQTRPYPDIVKTFRPLGTVLDDNLYLKDPFGLIVKTFRPPV
jgi:hypothetical protein